MGILKIFKKEITIPYKNYFGTLFGKKNPVQRFTPENVLGTKASLMHADGSGTPGYSLDGNFVGQVRQQYNEYEDGVPNQLPPPSKYDLNGLEPPVYKNPE